LTLDGGEWLASRPGLFITWANSVWSQRIWECILSWIGLDILERTEISYLCWESKHGIVLTELTRLPYCAWLRICIGKVGITAILVALITPVHDLRLEFGLDPWNCSRFC